MKDGNIKSPEKELQNLYILIGATNGEVDQSIYDRVWELEKEVNPLFEDEVRKIDFSCDCGRRDCWECVYKDDPMGI